MSILVLFQFSSPITMVILRVRVRAFSMRPTPDRLRSVPPLLVFPRLPFLDEAEKKTLLDLKGLAHAKIIKKSVILFWLLNTTI